METQFEDPRVCSRVMLPPAPPPPDAQAAPGKLFAAPYWPSATVGEDKDVPELAQCRPWGSPVISAGSGPCFLLWRPCELPSTPDLPASPVRRLSAKRPPIPASLLLLLLRNSPARHPSGDLTHLALAEGWPGPTPDSGQLEGVSCHQRSQPVPLEPHHRCILLLPHGRGP